MPSIVVAVAALGDLLDGEIELVARDEVDRRRGRQGSRSGCTATLAPTKPILSAGFASFSACGDLHVGGEGRRRGVDHDELVFARPAAGPLELDAARAARRSACCRAPARRAGPARSDTRTSGSPAAPDSASRRRRRSPSKDGGCRNSVFIMPRSSPLATDGGPPRPIRNGGRARQRSDRRN